ncbi:lasso peptide biosynthesis B2 protein [Acinetobacter nosocomialis]|uniref:lasso peptide biosynthesis B2 protein n=1 Tax=Acinetobacter nosocomialis TaxID=106654 RepID=UPI003D6D2539
MLYIFLFIGKDYFINQKLNLIKKIKKSKKLEHNPTYCRAIGNYIHKISNKLPFNMKCLEYSLILSTFLLLKQYDCTFKIGIQKYDFLSHAWVEVDNQPIADMPNLSYRLAVIFEI